MNYLICMLLGYLFGIINPAFLFGRSKGFDIRTRGSHNPGASNATITMGWGIGVLVGLLDILKAVVAVVVAKALFPAFPAAGFAAGAACVLGHMFPFYLRFRGGKGFASYVGMILVLDWKFFLVIGVLIVLITVITDYIAIATLTTIVVFPAYLLFVHLSWVLIVLIAVPSGIMLIKHIPNIRKILRGEEIGLRKVGKN